jgi:hypothetical protein
MAKHVILEAYTFNKDTRVVTVIGKAIRREQLLLITNTTTNQVIYNFSDSSLTATAYTNSVDAITGQETTTITLNFNTTAMLNTHRLAIVVEETYQEMIPAEVMRDPVDKMRVSTPQSLIDTDFEYGMQPTKWESLNLLNNRPSAFYDSTQGLSSVGVVPTFVGAVGTYTLAGVSVSGRVVTVSITNAQASLGGITAGTPIFIQGTTDVGNVDGWWTIEAVAGSNPNYTFTFTVNTSTAAPTAGSIFDTNKTFLFIGSWFTGASISTTSIVGNGTRATVTTTGAHGLRVGDHISIIGTTSVVFNGTWVIEKTETTNTFTFLTTTSGTATLSGALTTLYPRAQGYVQHRPFDGGVQFSNVQPYHGYQVIRQTRRQFRYQSGKAIQFSTGSIVKPALALDNMTSSGTTVTVTTKFPHGLQVGASLRVTGALTVGGASDSYNGLGVSGGSTYVVTAVTSPLVFTYTASSIPSASPAIGFPINIGPNTWYGSANRVGMFDSQNGFFFEFDGQQIYCVRRNSTAQLSGIVSVTNAASLVTGTNTRFSEQLKPGDFIVIRGLSYVVQTIIDNTNIRIYPEYRGATAIACQVSKTIDVRVPQSAWNIDRLDGTGHSLYNLDLTRMQMFYIDYTWYGAGAIRYGFKNARGEVVYCHRTPNNNTNTEAYLRSGNLVGRYETNTLPVTTFLTATLSSGATTVFVADLTNFPPAGFAVITAAADTAGAIEYIQYTGRSTTTGAGSLTGVTRNITNLTIPGGPSGITAAGGTASATTFTLTGVTAQSIGGTAPVRVELYSPQQASTISHWGSSVIMDGRFDDDKSLVFVAGQTRTQTLTNVGQDVTVPLISIRIAPSVDNGLTGMLGQREIVNRMQLTLRSMAAQTTGTSPMVFLITLRLNGRVSGGTFAAAGGSSLAQVAYHSSGQTIAGGENIFAFYTNTPGVTGYDLSAVRDIGTSILGGGSATSMAVPTGVNGVYPDGPDIITVCATNITTVTTNSINARISWTEAQA